MVTSGSRLVFTPAVPPQLRRSSAVMAARRFRVAWCSLDFTVPIGTPTTSAIEVCGHARRGGAGRRPRDAPARDGGTRDRARHGRRPRRSDPARPVRRPEALGPWSSSVGTDAPPRSRRSREGDGATASKRSGSRSRGRSRHARRSACWTASCARSTSRRTRYAIAKHRSPSRSMSSVKATLVAIPRSFDQPRPHGLSPVRHPVSGRFAR